MARTKVTADDRERFAEARRRGRRYAARATAVAHAQFDVTRDSLEVRLRDGSVRLIPRTLLPELDAAPATTLRTVTVSPAGDVISWRRLDVQVSTRGIFRRARRVSSS